MERKSLVEVLNCRNKGMAAGMEEDYCFMEDRKIKVYDRNAQGEIDYRKKEVEQHLENIRQILNGHAGNLYAGLLDESGKIDAAKLDTMIDDMIGALIRYRKNFGEKALSKKQEKWYRSYLYLAVTGPRDIDWNVIIGKYYSEKNFSDIYKYTDLQMDRKDLYELIWRETHSWSMPGDEEENFLYTLKDAMESLTGKDIRCYYTKEEKAVLEELQPILDYGWVDVPEDMDIRTFLEEVKQNKIKIETGVRTKEDFIKYLIETGQFNIAEPKEEEEDDEYEYVDPADQQEMWEQHERETEEEIADSINAWLSRLPEEHRFEKEYLYFRRNYLSVDRSSFRADMEHLVDAYLYEQGRTAYSLGDNYGIVDNALSVAEGRIYHEIVRARNLREDD